MTDLKLREEQLHARLMELTGRLERIDEHLHQSPNPDWEEEAQEAEMDEVLEELGQTGATEVRAIRAALDRIKGGTYGVCTRCGAGISTERLDILPHTPLCKDCAHEVGGAKH